ncbi:MAG: HD domain-containing protein [Deltaproteobacteria bacterium]|nr:HD domain-containing protein [Deltaproteobacteria bacterium]
MILIDRTKTYVKQTLEKDSSGHDWPHVRRVHHHALMIAQEEGGDLLVIELAALLHDIADWKFHRGDDSVGPHVAREWLQKMDVAPDVTEHVCSIIASMSFKGAKTISAKLTLEGQIVQDADRLDAIGAIGIARAFAYGGFSGQPMHDEKLLPKSHQSFEDYKSSKTTTINHFYEKLLLLKDRMNTATAKQLAEDRHEFLEVYLNRFLSEWS